MTLTVRQRADIIGTLRYATVFAMETLARWVPTTPDLEAKVLFGRHIWEFAQHADALGKRTHELRAALHYTPAPLPDYATALEQLRVVDGARQRIESFYEAFLPDLSARFRAYLRSTDPFLDEPSVRIIERILVDQARMLDESRDTRAQRPDMTSSGGPGGEAVRQRLESATAYVKHREHATSVADGLA